MSTTVAITAYPATCLALPRLLKSQCERLGVVLKVFGLSRSVQMLRTVVGEDPANVSDIVMMTWGAGADLAKLKANPAIEVRTTHESLFPAAVAPCDDLEGAERVGWEWLQDKDLVTYHRDEAGLKELFALIYGPQGPASVPSVHMVHDTLTLNAMVQAGWAYGVSAGLNRPVEVFPGIVSVPIGRSPAYVSVVAVNRRRRDESAEVRALFEFLVECDSSREPGWLRQDIAANLPERQGGILQELAEKHKVTQAQVVAAALELYQNMLELQKSKELLQVPKNQPDFRTATRLSVLAPRAGQLAR